jgi:hypothetical protein
MIDAGVIRLFGTPTDFFKSEDPFIKKFVGKVREHSTI